MGRHGSVCIAAGTGLAALAICPLLASGAQPVHNGLIVFQRNLISDRQIPRLFSIHSNGSGESILWRTKGDVSDPFFSPNGRTLVFVRGLGLARKNGLVVPREAIYTSDAHLQGARKRYAPPLGKHVSSPVYSPDGRHIAFVELTSKRRNSLALRIMDSRGAHAHTVHVSAGTFSNSYGGRELAFSPDGTEIVFGKRTRGGKSELYEMNVEGCMAPASARPCARRPVHQLTSTTGNDGSWGPDFSPDGTKIVFSRYTRGGVPEVFVMNADGSLVRRLIAPGPDSKAQGYRSPVFSPDGTQLAFVGAFDGPDDAHELFVAQADGSAQRRLTHSVCADNCGGTNDNDNPTWQPILGP